MLGLADGVSVEGEWEGCSVKAFIEGRLVGSLSFLVLVGTCVTGNVVGRTVR